MCHNSKNIEVRYEPYQRVTLFTGSDLRFDGDDTGFEGPLRQHGSCSNLQMFIQMVWGVPSF
jgi:hypothetical protein